MMNEKIIRALIIEDEPKNVELLKKMLDMYCPKVSVCGSARSVKDAADLIKLTNPDLVFLDIEISGGNSFHLLDMLQPVNFDIIFVTAYDNYLLQAIKYSALDYLFKPINIQELITAVNKSVDKASMRKTSEQIELLLQNFSAAKTPATLALPTAFGLEFIAVQNIVRAEAKGSYTVLFMNNGKSYTVSKALKEYEDLLPQDIFFRIHHSYLINLRFIVKYHKGKGGVIEMTDKSMMPLAARRKNEFINLFLQGS
jgi:two-component system, LytTR family, response regulator